MKKLFLILFFYINTSYALEQWQCIDKNCFGSRLKVHSGWIVTVPSGTTFVPDHSHEWRL